MISLIILIKNKKQYEMIPKYTDTELLEAQKFCAKRKSKFVIQLNVERD